MDYLQILDSLCSIFKSEYKWLEFLPATATSKKLAGFKNLQACFLRRYNNNHKRFRVVDAFLRDLLDLKLRRDLRLHFDFSERNGLLVILL